MIFSKFEQLPTSFFICLTNLIASFPFDEPRFTKLLIVLSETKKFEDESSLSNLE